MKQTLILFCLILVNGLAPALAQQSAAGSRTHALGPVSQQLNRTAARMDATGSVLTIGVAAAVHGEVAAVSTDQSERSLKSGMPLYAGDQVKTGTDSRLQIILRDETVFTLGEDSALTLDEFVYDPKSKDGVVNVKIMKGVFSICDWSNRT